eukprot:GEMP01017236.1.p1 GENE.GEMP01017236.1~~GEMP01017236.1.p1  ORF type:complete len:437 (+),score=69.80 GEMP01017236.1:27-1313(+)
MSYASSNSKPAQSILGHAPSFFYPSQAPSGPTKSTVAHHDTCHEAKGSYCDIHVLATPSASSNEDANGGSTTPDTQTDRDKDNAVDTLRCALLDMNVAQLADVMSPLQREMLLNVVRRHSSGMNITITMTSALMHISPEELYTIFSAGQRQDIVNHISEIKQHQSNLQANEIFRRTAIEEQRQTLLCNQVYWANRHDAPRHGELSDAAHESGCEDSGTMSSDRLSLLSWISESPRDGEKEEPSRQVRPPATMWNMNAGPPKQQYRSYRDIPTWKEMTRKQVTSYIDEQKCMNREAALPTEPKKNQLIGLLFPPSVPRDTHQQHARLAHWRSQFGSTQRLGERVGHTPNVLQATGCCTEDRTVSSVHDKLAHFQQSFAKNGHPVASLTYTPMKRPKLPTPAQVSDDASTHHNSAQRSVFLSSSNGKRLF